MTIFIILIISVCSAKETKRLDVVIGLDIGATCVEDIRLIASYCFFKVVYDTFMPLNSEYLTIISLFDQLLSDL